MVTPLAPQQLAGILPRQAMRMVQDALQAAGCPDADYDARELLRIAAGKDPRLLFDPLTRPQAECLAELAWKKARRRCNTCKPTYMAPVCRQRQRMCCNTGESLCPKACS